MQTSFIIVIAGYTVLACAVVVMVIMLRRKDGKEIPLPSTRLLRDESKPSDEYDELIERLIGLFETEKICLKTDIHLSDVATMLAVGKGTLSRAIKMKTGKNFCQLVHYYRIREAMRIYANHPKLSAREISKMVGFNSLTTFITAFGRHTGSTPAEWCRQYKSRAEGLGYGYKKTRRSA